MIRLVLAALLIIPGLLTLGIAMLGLFRFSSALNRIHAASMCDTLGTLLVLSGLIVLSGFTVLSLKLLLAVLFLWLGNPAASHLVAQAEARTRPDLDRICDLVLADEKEGD